MNQVDKIILSFFFFLSLNVFGQEPSIKNYNITTGLPGNECYRILQDQKGYIWVASDEGVSRYNGYSFQNFTKKDGLPDNVIIHLFEDKKGRIWTVGLNSKIACFENETFRDLKELNLYLKSNAKKAQISSVYVDDKDELHLGFNVFYPYLVTYSLGKNKVVEQKRVGLDNLYIVANKSNHSVFGLNNDYYSPNSVLHIKIEQETKNQVLIDVNFKVRPSSSHYLSVKDNSFLISIDKDLFIIKDNKIEKVLTYNSLILFLYKDNAGRVWVLVHNDGAYVFDVNDIHYQEPQHVFEGYSFSSITEDRESSYWLSSLNGGIYQIPNFNIVHYQIKESYKNVGMNAVVKHNGIIYSGGYSKNIYAFDKENKLKKCFELPNENVEVYDMRSQNNTLIIAGLSSYLVHINSDGIRMMEIKDKKKNDGVKQLRYIDPVGTDKNFVLSGNRIGWYKINLGNAHAESFLPIPPSTVNMIYTDPSNEKIYAASLNGLYYTSDKTHSYYKIKDSLLNTRINCITKKDSLFILSSKERGLVFWDGQKLWSINASNCLISNECRKAQVDKCGNIWVSTNKGLSKIEKTVDGKFKIKNLTSNEGLAGDDVSNFSIIDTDVWIPNENGLSKISTTLDIKNNAPPPIYITSVAVDDSLYKAGSFLEIPYQHNYIKINYNGLSYKNDGGLLYEYRLVGLDSGWKKTKNIQTQFTRLSEGNYLFEVRAIKNNDVKSIYAATFGFIIYPPWYKTWTFIILSFISIVIIIYLIFWTRFKRLKAKEEEKTRLIKLVTETEIKALEEKNKLITLITETEIKALRAQTNPHFIFNALNSIRLFVLKNDSEQAQFYLMQFAQLMRDVLENSEHEVIDIGKEFSILRAYMELEILRFKGKYKFEISIPEDLSAAHIKIPPLLLQPIIENAIWHGLMPLEGREGLLVLKAVKNDNAVIITIEDNGIGRKRSAEIKMGKITHKTSKGMFMTQNRIDLFNKKYTEKIKIITTDLTDDNLISIGTRVELIIENT